MASVMLVIFSPFMGIIAILIKRDSKGSVFFRQERVTTYGKKFRIHKFRTMVVDAESKSSQVTEDNDDRVTKIGNTLRKYRLDEIPQLLDIIAGNMSFVGTRPEVSKYVEKYTNVPYEENLNADISEQIKESLMKKLPSFVLVRSF